MIHQEIAVLRGMDKAQTLVEQLLHQQQTNTPQIFSQAVMEGLHQLLEKADNLTTKPQVKFMARTIYICLTLHAQDMFDCQTALDSITKSSLLLAYETQENPQNYSQFLLNGTNSEQDVYSLSAEDLEVKSKIYEILGQSNHISTPYDYVELLAKHLPMTNFEQLSKIIIDLCLTIPETYGFSSEDILVGACLYIHHKYNCQDLDDSMKTYFGGSYAKGEQLMDWLKQQFDNQPTYD